MAKIVFALLPLLFLFQDAACDVYMHNPRGSNDRNCERNVNRNNGNRLFDSQNNAKGGYACPRAVGGPEIPETQMHYYVGSKLPFQWTSQHGCGGNSNVHCEIVIQYMCNDASGNPDLRDGTPDDVNDAATDTIPDDPTKIGKKRFGYHETYDWYQKCKYRSRNRGLFIADRNINENAGARATRQNNNGNRRGLECPEERDYYPYWTPTPWRDAAVLVDDPSRCKYFQDNSNNVKKYGECELPPATLVKYKNGKVPIEEEACVDIGGKWVTKSHGIPPPECKVGPWQRDNHLGNAHGGYDASYNWTIPDFPQSKCVVRLRYNISTGDYPGGPPTPFASNAQNAKKKQNNKFPFPIVTDNSTWDAKVRQDVMYQFTESIAKGKAEQLWLEMAANTNQFGRTFQDRSYTFQIKARPASFKDKTIHNLGVTGKRGNIVQTYPAHEYDFAPKNLYAKQGDYIHFQWEGSDYNPRRGPNNGEGGPPDKADNDPNKDGRADRSNIVETDLADPSTPHFKGTPEEIKNSMFPDIATAWKMAFIDQPADKCLSIAELKEIQNTKGNRVRENHIGNCGKLNAAESPYFNGGLVQMTKVGRFTYMSTRNNNFSNRSHKGHVTVFQGASAPKEPEFAGLVAPGVPNPAFAAFTASGGQKGRDDPAKFALIGCFKDERTRDLPMHALSSNKVEPHKCMEICKNAGFKYAATQASNECFCGNHYGRYGPAALKECHQDCQGDNFYKCGGPWRNMVYNVTAERVSNGGCWITAKSCPTKPSLNGTWWDSTQLHTGTDSDEVQCHKRAEDFFKYCFNRRGNLSLADDPITATFSSAGKNTTMTYPSKAAGGCLINITVCRNKRQPTGWFYESNNDAIGANTEESACLKRARDYYRACDNRDEVPVEALFVPTGAKRAFPGVGGGCLINNSGKCGRDVRMHGANVYDMDAGDYVDFDETSCLLRAKSFYDGCGMNAFNNNSAVTATFASTGKQGSFPGSTGGCIVDNPSCPKKPNEQKKFWDQWAQQSTNTNEAACLARSTDYFDYCHATQKFGGLTVVEMDNSSTAYFAPTSKKASYPGTAGGCLYEMKTCRSKPDATKNAWLDQSKLSGLVESVCHNELVSLHHACKNYNGDEGKVTFLSTGKSATFSGDGNLAMHKPLKASSDAHNWKMDKINDGTTDGHGHGRACWHTETETNPWAQIDLGAPTAIESVVVYNRLDAASDRLNGFGIWAGTTEANLKAIKENITAENITTVSVKGTYRFVKLMLPGTRKIINLCEIEVYGAGGKKTNVLQPWKAGTTTSSKVEGALLGCYVDSGRRDLPLHVYSSAKTSPELCLQACDAAGFKFAGVQHRECFCGNDYGRLGKRKADEAQCTQVKCAGNDKYFCGGDWTNLVYSVEKYAKSAAPSVAEGGGCWISQKSCMREGNKKHTGKFWDTEAHSDLDETRCFARARDWYHHCQNWNVKSAAPELTTATMNGKSMTYPGTAGGCTVEIKQCKKDAGRVGTKFVNNWWLEVSETACLQYARTATHECQNFEGQPAIVATFTKTGKTASWPSKAAGGCVFDFPSKCDKYPAWAGKKALYAAYDGHRSTNADYSEGACLAQAQYMYTACANAEYDGEGVKATYLPTAATATFPHKDVGGCVITGMCKTSKEAKATTRFDFWGQSHYRSSDSEGQCLERAKSWSDGCQNGAAGYEPKYAVTATFLGTGKEATYPGTHGGCTIKLADCKRDANLAYKSFLDTHNGAHWVESGCFQRGWDWYHHCQNPLQNVTATFGPTGTSIGTYMGKTTTLLQSSETYDLGEDHLVGQANSDFDMPAYTEPVLLEEDQNENEDELVVEDTALPELEPTEITGAQLLTTMS